MTGSRLRPRMWKNTSKSGGNSKVWRSGSGIGKRISKGGHIMFEHHSEPLAPQAVFARRMLRYSLATAGIILFSLFIGILGYHYLESLSWIDSLLNSSMILGGMGPVNPLQ